MYTITRKNRIKEDLQLCHANGDVALTLSVDINVDEISGRLTQRQRQMQEAAARAQNAPDNDDAVKAYGEAIIAFFDVIFGEEGAKQLIAFYEDNYTEMLIDVFPFINDEILPKIAEASADRKEKLLAAVNAAKKGNRASRRAFGR